MKSNPSRPYWIINAFTTGEPFSGNPAAVVPLAGWLPDATLQAIAAQHNLSETAFLVAEKGGWRLRWFTPACEVDLCGHATLAAAAVLFEIEAATERCRFFTRSGELRVERGEEGRLEMDFPSQPAAPQSVSGELEAVFGPIQAVGRNALDYLLVELEAAEAVKAFVPEMEPLRALEAFGVILTAKSENPEVDFVSRFFAPRAGVLEDPVTGSAHCTLFPWWAQKLGRQALRAIQCSPRGGLIEGRLDPDERIRLGGRAEIFAQGTSWVSEGPGGAPSA